MNAALPSPVLGWLRVLLLWLGGVFAAMQFSKVSLAFTALQQHYQATPTQMGWMLSAVGLVGLVFGVAAGWYAPRIGYRRVLLIGLVLGALMAALQTLMLPMGLMFATRLGEAVSQLAVVVGAPTLIVAHVPARHRAVALGLWSTFVGVGFALTAAFHAAIEARWGLPGIFAIHALGLGVLAVLAAIMLPPDAADERFAPSLRSPWPDWRGLPAQHRRIYTQPGTALPGLCFFCYTVVAIALLTFVPRLAGADGGWLALALPFVGIAGNFSSGGLVQAGVPPMTLVRASFVAVVVAALIAWLSLHLGTGFAPAGLVLMFVVSISGGAAYGLAPLLNPHSEGQAGAYGALAQMGNLGSTLGPPLFATLIAALQGFGMVLPVVCAGCMGLVLVRWGARRMRSDSP